MVSTNCRYAASRASCECVMDRAAPFSAAMKFILSFRSRDVDTSPLRSGCGDESSCPNLALDLHWPWASTVLNLYKSSPAASGGSADDFYLLGRTSSTSEHSPSLILHVVKGSVTVTADSKVLRSKGGRTRRR